MSKVYIIGTGPGDEELLTLKAVEVLKDCTAVLYDRLVSNNILNYLKEECEIYYCGKEPGCHYKTQDEINETLVKLAKEGHTVGRIKGGDPYVFGRGGEEVLSLVSCIFIEFISVTSAPKFLSFFFKFDACSRDLVTHILSPKRGFFSYQFSLLFSSTTSPITIIQGDFNLAFITFSSISIKVPTTFFCFEDVPLIITATLVFTSLPLFISFSIMLPKLFKPIIKTNVPFSFAIASQFIFNVPAVIPVII